MYVDARILILQILESCCWRLASLFGRLDILLRHWADAAGRAQLWAIDKALVAFQATLPPMPPDLSSAEGEPPAPDPSPPEAPSSLLVPDAQIQYLPSGSVLH